jgi:hypothetical protein
MNLHPEAAKNSGIGIMQLLRETEGRLIQCRREQAARIRPFRVRSFMLGLLVGFVAAVVWLFFGFRG